MTTQAPAFQQWLDAFFAEYYRHRPVNATFIGVHDFDDRLPDFSEAGVDACVVGMADLQRRLRELAERRARVEQLLQDHSKDDRTDGP